MIALFISASYLQSFISKSSPLFRQEICVPPLPLPLIQNQSTVIDYRRILKVASQERGQCISAISIFESEASKFLVACVSTGKLADCVDALETVVPDCVVDRRITTQYLINEMVRGALMPRKCTLKNEMPKIFGRPSQLKYW